jgi:hypothetical protein
MAVTWIRRRLSLQSSEKTSFIRDYTEAASFPPASTHFSLASLFEVICSSETSRVLQLRGDEHNKKAFLFKFLIYYDRYIHIEACSHSPVLC